MHGQKCSAGLMSDFLVAFSGPLLRLGDIQRMCLIMMCLLKYVAAMNECTWSFTVFWM